jgi:signal transduction histidine kinase
MTENRRILVVDDDSGIRDAIKNIFAVTPESSVMDEGRALFGNASDPGGSVTEELWEIAAAESGEDGVLAIQGAVAHERPFAMVFLDMKMPGIDGAETARRIWQSDPHVKIVIMTAYSEFKPEEISAVAGREELFYLKKPFTRGEIRQFARSLIHQWNLERERDRLQNELRDSNLHLEEKVRQRTRQLERAHSKLEVLDRDKMTFLRYLSHEMKTPLHWIGVAGVIEREALTESDREMLDFVNQGFERLDSLVQAVLDYFEMAGRELLLHREPVSVPAAISDILQEKAEKIEQTGITMDIRIDRDQTVDADPAYFHELLQTLLNNAVEYSNPGGTVTLTVKEDGEAFSMEIVDQGKGIPFKNLEKIFEAFALESFDRREAGYGLSLPRARLIAEAHGWRIRAESGGAGKGTRLVVEGPMTEDGGQGSEDGGK